MSSKQMPIKQVNKTNNKMKTAMLLGKKKCVKEPMKKIEKPWNIF